MSADATAFNAMVGLGETYLPAFVLALTASQVASGLVSTVPLLAGALLQLVSPWMTQRWQSYRRWVVVCAVIQAVAFVPLVGAAGAGAMPLGLVFLAVAIYWGAGMAGGPAWIAWVEAVIPGRIRARYFARRTRLGQGGLVLGFVIGGVALQIGAATGHRLWAFALVFLAAAASRIASARFLASQHELPSPGIRLRWPRIDQIRDHAMKDRRVRVIGYLLAVQLAVQMASPYFTPYMLRHLEFSYARYMILTCTAYVAKIAVLPLMGRLADRHGVHQLLWFGGVAIIPLSGLWTISDHFGYLLMLQVYSGTAWAAFELAMLLLLFEDIPHSYRVGVLTVYNLINAVATAGGSLIGCAVLWAFAASRESYLLVFALSSVARGVALILLVGLPAAAGQPAAAASRVLPSAPPAPHFANRPAAGAGSVPAGPHWPASPQVVLSRGEGRRPAKPDAMRGEEPAQVP